jgi:AAA ATPase domain
VHFGAASVPFAPVVQALDHRAQEVERGVRSSVLEGADELSKLLPSMAVGSADVPSSRLLPVVDRVVQRIATGQPTVLVIDDLQWADVSSLDVLAYLITGFRGQNLALVVTIREEDRPAGHPLHGWLADVRRLPGVSELVLSRLDPDECTEQIAALLGRPPGEELVGDVLARSGGNAYFTELLVRDLPADAQRPVAFYGANPADQIELSLARVPDATPSAEIEPPSLLRHDAQCGQSAPVRPSPHAAPTASEGRSKPHVVAGAVDDIQRCLWTLRLRCTVTGSPDVAQ